MIITVDTHIKTDLTIQKDGDNYTVGRIDISEFIRIPKEGKLIIEYANNGNTISTISQNTNIDKVDVIEFIKELIDIDFIKSINNNEIYANKDYNKKINTNLIFLSRFFFNKYFIFIMFVILFLFFYHYGFIEKINLFNGNILFSNTYPGLNLILLSLLGLSLTIFHEIGHYFGALFYEIPVKFNLNLRFIVIVIEAEMNNIWSLPKNKRYKAILGGPYFDLISLNIFFFLYFLGMIDINFLTIIITLITTQFLFQLLIFFRTDLYFLILNRYNISSLHKASIKALNDKKIFKQSKEVTMYSLFFLISVIFFILFLLKSYVNGIIKDTNMFYNNVTTNQNIFLKLDSILGLTAIAIIIILTIFLAIKNKSRKDV